MQDSTVFCESISINLSSDGEKERNLNVVLVDSSRLDGSWRADGAMGGCARMKGNEFSNCLVREEKR